MGRKPQNGVVALNGAERSRLYRLRVAARRSLERDDKPPHIDAPATFADLLALKVESFDEVVIKPEGSANAEPPSENTSEISGAILPCSANAEPGDGDDG